MRKPEGSEVSLYFIEQIKKPLTKKLCKWLILGGEYRNQTDDLLTASQIIRILYSCQ